MVSAQSANNLTSAWQVLDVRLTDTTVSECQMCSKFRPRCGHHCATIVPSIVTDSSMNCQWAVKIGVNDNFERTRLREKCNTAVCGGCTGIHPDENLNATNQTLKQLHGLYSFLPRLVPLYHHVRATSPLWGRDWPVQVIRHPRLRQLHQPHRRPPYSGFISSDSPWTSLTSKSGDSPLPAQYADRDNTCKVCRGS